MSADETRSASDWDQFLQQSRPDIGFKQTSWWADFLTCRDWKSFGVVLSHEGSICGGANVLVNPFGEDKCYYYVPHGPVLPDDEQDAAEIFAAIVEYVDQQRRCRETRRVSHLRLEPYWTECPAFVQGFERATSWHEPRDSLWIDLTLSEVELLAQMKPKGRYNIRLARRHGVTVVKDDSAEGLEDFVTLYKRTVERQHIRSRSTDYFRSLTEVLFQDERGSLFFAEYEGTRLATVMIIYAGHMATYLYGGTSLEHRAVMAPYLLHFEAMLHATRRGCRWYDMYGVSSPGKPDGSWANFSAFKRKFGGREMAYVPSLDLIYDQEAYREFRTLNKRN